MGQVVREYIICTKKGLEPNPSHLVEASGLEPPTPTLSGWCSNLLSYASIYENEHDARFLLFTARGSGGDERDRTADPLLARQVLSQLSYTPMSPRARILYHF